jgi:hypothetical protein
MVMMVRRKKKREGRKEGLVSNTTTEGMHMYVLDSDAVRKKEWTRKMTVDKSRRSWGRAVHEQKNGRRMVSCVS